MSKHARQYIHRAESTIENNKLEHEAWALNKLGVTHVGNGRHRKDADA